MPSEDASRYPQDASDEDRASLSPNGSIPIPNHGPSWPRPRSPIPPHRLAKLANALGISAPIPVSQASSDSITSASLPSKPTTPEARRSPAPSVASTPQLISHSPVPLFQSKFLLHVVPPLHIPHESSSSEDLQLTHPPPSAFGYHTQFERGTLVPLLPTLQSQLWTIAKEYALPSTAGMVLYLVSSARIPNPEASSTVPDEPGPRLSEDIWKHLWTRVTKFETESYSHLATPTTGAGLGFGYVGPTPLLPHEIPPSSNTLRPLISPGRVTPQPFPLPLTPTGSTASSTQATSSETSQSEVDTPDTSLPSDSRATTLDLPGLTSPSIIPILAKVEFDIDKRKATWYEPWIRSRKLNHQKRGQRARTGSNSGTSPVREDVSRGDIEAEDPKIAPLPLKLVDRQAIPRFLLSAGEEGDDNHESGYPCLSESPPGLEVPDSDSMTLSYPAKTENDSVDDDDETSWESRERPKLALDIPSSSPSVTVHPPLPTAGAMTTAAYKKAPPPPLTLMPYSHDITASTEPSPLPTSDSTGLAYLRDGVSTPSDGSKRTGTVFDELDLGLEFEDTGEFDENDPNDRRRSQYVLKAKLDEIEKTLVRLSPRGLQHETTPPEPRPSLPSNASGRGNELSNQPNAAWPAVPYSSPKQQDVKADSSLGPDNFLAPPKLSPSGLANPLPVSPYKQSFPTLQSREIDESNARRGEHEPTFPEIDPALRKPSSATSPTIPLSPDPFGRFPSSSPPSTSQASTSSDRPLSQHRAKYSTSEVPPERRPSRGSLSHKNSLASRTDAESRPPSSRFSLDSSDDGGNNRTSVSLNPVKSIKSLWKKGRKASISFVAGSSPTLQTGPGRTSPLPPPPVPSFSSTPTTSTTPRSLTPVPSTASRESVTSLALPPDRLPHKPLYYDTPSLSTTQLQQSRSSPSINSMIFNQESPYPVHVIPPHSVAQPRTASQAARIVSVSFTDVDVVPPTVTTSADREKAGAPKSILKSRHTDSSATSPPLPPEQLATRRNPPRADPVARQSTLTGGGGQVTPPSSFSEPTRVSPTMARRRSSRARPLSRPSPDEESFKTMDPMPRLELDQHTR